MYEKFFKNLAIKTIKTFFQSFAGCLTAGTLISDMDWKYALSASLLAAIYCLAFNIGTNLPEEETANEEENENKNEKENEEEQKNDAVENNTQNDN